MDEISELPILASFDSSLALTPVTAGGTKKSRREMVDTVHVEPELWWAKTDRCTIDLGDFTIGLG